MKEKILIVEDDVAILTGLTDLLTNEGYHVLSTTDGDRALEIFKNTSPDIILLDIMIPEKNGYEVCQEIRKTNSHIPIIMLTAKGQEVDKIVGLELGADDYVVKPFSVNELLARIRARLRRLKISNDSSIKNSPLIFGDISINPKTLQGTKKGTHFTISQREIHILQIFLDHDGEVLDRFTLLDKAWGISYEGTTRTLDQHICKLRQKIEDNPSSPQYIKTVHGAGYRFLSKGK